VKEKNLITAERKTDFIYTVTSNWKFAKGKNMHRKKNNLKMRCFLSIINPSFLVDH
jgi:hypothetical protein